MRPSLTALALSLVAVNLWGAEGPQIMGQPAVADQTIAGKFTIYPACTPSLELFIRDRLIKPVRLLIEGSRGEFEIQLADPLVDGDTLKVRHSCGGNQADSPVVTVKTQPTPPVKIRSTEATYGAGKVRIFFEAIPSSVVSATLTVKTCLEETVRKLTADELKKTDLEVTLARNLFCSPDPKDTSTADAKNSAALTVSRKGASAGEDKQKISIGFPQLQLDAPLREGTTRLTGKAGSGIVKVAIVVYSGWITNTNGASQGGSKATKGCDAACLQRIEELAARVRVLEQKGIKPEQAPGNDVRILTIPNRARLPEETQGPPAVDASPGLLDQPTPDQQRAEVACNTSELDQVKEEAVAEGVFVTTLTRPLQAGECVQVLPIYATPPIFEDGSPRIAFVTPPEIVKPVLEDWARLRGYFSLGAAIDHYNEQFNRQDYFIGWTSDALIGGKVVDKINGRAGASYLRKVRYHFNVFSEARVRIALATGNANAGNAMPGATVTTQRLLPPNLQAAQAGFFQIGLHLPVSWKGMDFVNRGQQFSFFVSPIVKLGGESLDRDLVTYQLKQNFGSTTPNGTIHREESRRGVLPLWGYGARFGLYKYEIFGDLKQLRNRQVTNDPIGYVDFTWGKAHSFRSYTYKYSRRVPTAGNPSNIQVSEVSNFQQIELEGLVSTEIMSTVKRRFAIEGRLKLFTLPALIGVDYNVRTNSSDWEPNQLRFVLAFRIDAQRALGRLFKTSAWTGEVD
jgi:hypothetical protein